MSVFSDPENWAMYAAKTKFRLAIMIVGHFVLLSLGLWELYELSKGSVEITYGEFVRASSLIVIFGAVYPSLYLYCIHRMLKGTKHST
ncbi:hypothetical protein ACSLBF_18130 (plasmid) [Pseudoalteromonas sp. T1lg65]|uniref:hypothetical protein n=1 Tax=Pseudoalteromonas sp. T1lg65 TaxID=2077101 RepID=UPI003F791964